MEDWFSDPTVLIDLVKAKMPFGKYEDTLICELPVSYLEWFQRKGFPKGKLGTYLHMMFEIKINGLEHLLTPIKKQAAS